MSQGELARDIGAALGVGLRAQPAARVAGGSINECYRWESGSGPLFVKLAAAAAFPMLEAEADGLEELHRAGVIRVPGVRGLGRSGERAWLALEWVRFGPSSSRVQRLLGEQLARLHQVRASAFGWGRHNTIGSTPQINTRETDWVTFLREHRLRYQLDLLRRNGLDGGVLSRGESLLESMAELFTAYRPAPSLLHGDLWGGNWSAADDGQPVIFDPAVYYGDREADLAMTRLFGGFGSDFYSGYESIWPLDSGAPSRVALYNLYHVLNHANLFGGGYLVQARALIDALLAVLR